MTFQTSRVRHFHRRAIEILTKMTKTQTTKSIKTKKVGLILSTKYVNALRLQIHGWIVWYCDDGSSTLPYFSINSKAHANNNKKFN